MAFTGLALQQLWDELHLAIDEYLFTRPIRNLSHYNWAGTYAQFRWGGDWQLSWW